MNRCFSLLCIIFGMLCYFAMEFPNVWWPITEFEIETQTFSCRFFFLLLLLIDKKWSFRKCAGFCSAFPFHIPPWFVCIYSAFGLMLFIFIFKMGRCKNTIGLNHKFSCECEDIPIFFVKISKSNQTAHKLNKTSWKPFCVLNLYWAFGSGVSCFFFRLDYNTSIKYFHFFFSLTSVWFFFLCFVFFVGPWCAFSTTKYCKK